MAFRAVPACFLPLPPLLLWALLLLVASGCGPITYTVDATSAERVVEQARAENASYYAPYELTFAEAYLTKAHEEAAQGEYEDAVHALSVAKAYGRRALTRSAQPGLLDR